MYSKSKEINWHKYRARGSVWQALYLCSLDGFYCRANKRELRSKGQKGKSWARPKNKKRGCLAIRHSLCIFCLLKKRQQRIAGKKQKRKKGMKIAPNLSCRVFCSRQLLWSV